MRDWDRYVREHLPSDGLEEAVWTRAVEDVADMLAACEAEALQSGSSPDGARSLAEARVPDWHRLAASIRAASRRPARLRVARRTGGMTMWTGFRGDLVTVLRDLGKRPGFTAVTCLTLALALGANTAIFSILDAVLWKPLPYERPERLVRIFSTHVEESLDRMGVSSGDIVDWRERNDVMTGIAGWYVMGRTLQVDGTVEVVNVAQVSEDFFPVLGVRPVLGRTFTAAETARARFNSAAAHVGTDPVVILSHRTWQSRFGSSPSIIGGRLVLDRQRFRIVGVLPREATFPRADVELWIPWSFEGDRPHDQRYLGAIGRLAAEVPIELAEERLNAVASVLAAELPASNDGWGVRLVSLHAEIVSGARPALVLVFIAVAAVLLLACVNIAGLQLVAIGERQREIAMRLALGASRLRLARQHLLSSLSLALVGGALALPLAAAALRLAEVLVPKGLPRLGEVSLDARVFAYAALLIVATAVFFGLVPLASASPRRLTDALRGDSRTSTGAPRWERVRELLVVSQIAMAVALLAAAGLLVRSFSQLKAVEPGFRPDRVLVLPIALDNHEYDSGAKSRAYYRRLLERLEAIPGVASIGAATALPMSPIGPDFDRPVWAEGEVPARGGAGRADVRMATPGYFETLGIPLVRGRGFTVQDGPDAPRVVIVNESLARQVWPGEDPVGKRLVIDYSTAGTYPYAVVGAVGDIRFHGLRALPRPELYLPHAQRPYLVMNVAVRTSVPPEGLVAELRRAVLEVDPMQPVYGVLPLAELVDGSVARDRFATWLLGGFAAVALVLALLGVFGVLSYHVGRRTHEVGIRAALGASRSELVRMMLLAGLRLTLVGLAAGLAVSAVSTRWLGGLLFGVSPLDPATFAAVILLLAGSALAACYVPARRAAWVDPASALRHE